MKLYEHQKKILDLNPKKYLIASGTGTGKTITALALAKQNNLRMLVVCPKQVRRKWHEAMVMMGVDGEVMGRDRFRIDVQKVKKYDALTWDECHVGLGNLKSKMSKACREYVKKHDVEYVWLLSGTPYSSQPSNIYALATVLGYKWNYIDFQRKFYQPRYLGQRMIWEPKTGIEDEMRALIQRIGDTTRLEDCFDVPDQILDVEFYDETPEQTKLREKIAGEESNPIVRITKYHQIASGTLKGNEFEETVSCACDKNDQIITYAQENKKVVIFSRYKAHLNLLADRLEAEGIPYAVVDGSVDDKETIFTYAEKADRFVLLVNAKICEGYEVPSFGLMIFASLDYSYVNYTQARHRILRGNALKKNVYKVLLTKGTIDEKIYESIKNKQSFSEAIYLKTMSDVQEVDDNGWGAASDERYLRDL